MKPKTFHSFEDLGKSQGITMRQALTNKHPKIATLTANPVISGKVVREEGNIIHVKLFGSGIHKYEKSQLTIK